MVALPGTGAAPDTVHCSSHRTVAGLPAMTAGLTSHSGTSRQSSNCAAPPGVGSGHRQSAVAGLAPQHAACVTVRASL